MNIVRSKTSTRAGQAKVFEANPQSVAQIKETICEVVAFISQETLHCVVEIFRRRLEACISAQGELFESCNGSA